MPAPRPRNVRPPSEIVDGGSAIALSPVPEPAQEEEIRPPATRLERIYLERLNKNFYFMDCAWRGALQMMEPQLVGTQMEPQSNAVVLTIACQVAIKVFDETTKEMASLLASGTIKPEDVEAFISDYNGEGNDESEQTPPAAPPVQPG